MRGGNHPTHTDRASDYLSHPPPPSVSQPGRPPPARRERKKRQLRDALIHAALELFEAKGDEQTAIREITDAVDVSVRTFFRYFASKEDLALSFMKDRTDMFLAALAARPAAEEPLTAARNAFCECLPEVADGGRPRRPVGPPADRVLASAAGRAPAPGPFPRRRVRRRAGRARGG